MTDRLLVNEIRGISNTVTVPTGYNIYSPGNIIQISSTTMNAATSISYSGNYTNYTDIPGVAVTMTPKSTKSSFYIRARVTGEFNPTVSNAWNSVFAIKRNGTVVGAAPQPGSVPCGVHMAAITYYADDPNSTPETCFFDMWDSPATLSAVTYQLCIICADNGTYYINRCVNAATSGGYERGTSSITVMEIGA